MRSTDLKIILKGTLNSFSASPKNIFYNVRETFNNVTRPEAQFTAEPRSFSSYGHSMLSTDFLKLVLDLTQ